MWSTQSCNYSIYFEQNSLTFVNKQYLNCMQHVHVFIHGRLAPFQVKEFEEKRDTLESELEQQTEVVNKLREQLAKVDDVSGGDGDLVSRLNLAKVCNQLMFITL